MNLLKPLWAYRGFILGSVKREFQSKYRNSLLGASWTVINPLAMIVVYTVIFSQIMRAKLPGVDSTFAYSIYLCAGVLTWGLFAEITGRAQNTFLENANLLKKLSFPRLCLPAMVVANAAKLFPFSIAEQSNDLVACFESLEHVEDDQLMLNQILRSLKKDGVALISVPNQDEHPLEKNPHQFHFRHYRHADFIGMVSQEYSIETWYGQNVYEFTDDGVNTFRLLSEGEMCLREKVPGQVNVYVIRRRDGA